jgi:hypothetical protein
MQTAHSDEHGQNAEDQIEDMLEADSNVTAKREIQVPKRSSRGNDLSAYLIVVKKWLK